VDCESANSTGDRACKGERGQGGRDGGLTEAKGKRDEVDEVTREVTVEVIGARGGRERTDEVTDDVTDGVKIDCEVIGAGDERDETDEMTGDIEVGWGDRL